MLVTAALNAEALTVDEQKQLLEKGKIGNFVPRNSRIAL